MLYLKYIFLSDEAHVQGVMAAHGEFLCNNSSIKDIGGMVSCGPADRYPHE
jgi:hypothetical protein